MIELIDVGKYYPTDFGKHWVFRNVSLKLDLDKSVAIIGPNGAGKSTFMRLLGGADIPSEGRIIRRGNVSPPMGLTPTLQGTLSGVENTRFAGRIYGLNRDEINEMIEYVRQTADVGKFFDMPVATYSAGMRQRVAFSINMSLHFDFYLFDEISAGGDREFKKFSKAKVKERLQTSKFIIASHHYDDLLDLCDAAIVIQNGELQYFEDMQEALSVYEIDSDDDGGDAKIRKREKRRARAEKAAAEGGDAPDGDNTSAEPGRVREPRDPAKAALRERRLAKVRAALEADDRTEDGAAQGEASEAHTPTEQPSADLAARQRVKDIKEQLRALRRDQPDEAAEQPDAEALKAELRELLAARGDPPRRRRDQSDAAASADNNAGGDTETGSPAEATLQPANDGVAGGLQVATPAVDAVGASSPDPDPVAAETPDPAEAERLAKREQKRLEVERRREKRRAKDVAAAEQDAANGDADEEAAASKEPDEDSAAEATDDPADEAVEAEDATGTARKKGRRNAGARRGKRRARTETGADDGASATEVASNQATEGSPDAGPSVVLEAQDVVSAEPDIPDGHPAGEDTATGNTPRRKARRARAEKRRARKASRETATDDPAEEADVNPPDTPDEDSQPPQAEVAEAEAPRAAPIRPAYKPLPLVRRSQRPRSTPAPVVSETMSGADSERSAFVREALLRQERAQAKAARAMRLLLQHLETQSGAGSPSSSPPGRTALIAAAQESAAAEFAGARALLEEDHAASATASPSPFPPFTPNADLRFAHHTSKTS